MFDDLTDEALDAKIVELRGKIEKVMSGEAVAVMAGEGRRIEYTRGNVDGLQQLLDSAITERDRRRNSGRRPGRALNVRHCY